MRPVHRLLARIRHNEVFDSGRFEIGYPNRRRVRVTASPPRRSTFGRQRRRFCVLEESGTARRIPFHRVREVYRDGQRIWQRPG